jgi:hypothetical protein
MNARTRFAATLFATALGIAPSVRAEGLAVRGPNLGQSVVFVEGVPESSRAVWIRPWLAITQEQRNPYDAFGLGVGVRHTIVGAPRGWAFEVQAHGGFTALTLLPGVAFTLSPSTHLRVRSERVWFSMGIAAPFAVRLDSLADVRIPLQGELWLAFRAGPVWLGAMTAAGASFAPSGPAAIVMQGAGYIAVPFGR